MNKTEYLQLKGAELYLGKLITFPHGACRFFYRKALHAFNHDAACESFLKDFGTRAEFIAWLNVPEASIVVRVEAA